MGKGERKKEIGFSCTSMYAMLSRSKNRGLTVQILQPHSHFTPKKKHKGGKYVPRPNARDKIIHFSFLRLNCVTTF